MYFIIMPIKNVFFLIIAIQVIVATVALKQFQINGIKAHSFVKSRSIAEDVSLKLYRKVQLDSPVLPSLISPKLASKHLGLTALAFVVLVSLKFLKPHAVNVISAIKISEIVRHLNFTRDWAMNYLVPNLSLGLRVLIAKIALFIEKVQRRISYLIYGDGESSLNLKSWNPGYLEEREVLKGNYVKYKFRLDDRSAVVPLAAGQDIQVCGIGDNDKVVKAVFFPISSPHKRGYFEILTRRDPSEINNVLESLMLSDEIAFKAGKCRLRFPKGSGGSISVPRTSNEVTGITIISSGLGIAPSVQILKQILSEDTTVEQIEFVWINENRADFVLQEEVEALELKHFEKFVTTKVLEANLFGVDLVSIPEINEATPNYQAGQVAIICAPDYISEYVKQLLISKSYPQESVLIITTSS